MIINSVMKPDGEIIRVVSGDPVKAHREGVKIAEKLFTEEINKLPDLVICSAYPADCDLWQSTKAMTVAAFCAKENGVVILFTPSQEGDCPGHPDFVGLGALNPDKVYEMTQKGSIEDVVAASVNMTVGVARERARIIVVTDITNRDYVEKLGLTYAKNFDEAKTKAEDFLGNIETVGVITHGGEFGPKLNV
jgi:nickel-dependent lactate racemase